MSNQPLVTVNGKEIFADDVLNYMKADNSFKVGWSYTVLNDVLRSKAAELSLEVSGEELQQEADDRRRVLGLHEKSALDTYLAGLGIRVDDWEESLIDSILRRKLRAYLGSVVFAGDAAAILGRDFRFRRLIGGAVRERAKAYDIEVSDEELQEESNNRRRVMGLHSLDDFNLYLQATGMGLEDWEHDLETDILFYKLRLQGDPGVSHAEVATILKTTGTLDMILMKMVMSDLVYAKAKDKEIMVSDEEIQEETNLRRRALNLHSAKAFEMRLAAMKTTIDEWIYEVETDLLIKKLTENNQTIIDEEKIMARFKAGLDFYHGLLALVGRHMMIQKAEELGVELTDEMVQAESDDYRRALGLHNAEAMNNFLQLRDIDLETWGDYIEGIALMRAIRAKVVTEDEITKVLTENKDLRRLVRDQLFAEWQQKQLHEVKLDW